MCKEKEYIPSEELKAIMDRLGEWRNKNGVDYVTMLITADGSGFAYTLKPGPRYVAGGEYGPRLRDGGSSE